MFYAAWILGRSIVGPVYVFETKNARELYLLGHPGIIAADPMIHGGDWSVQVRMNDACADLPPPTSEQWQDATRAYDAIHGRR